MENETRIGLALSGGGFRATLYHLGVVRYLRDAGLLESVSHVTSVSGGSVLAAHLVANWERYRGSDEEFAAAAAQILRLVSLDVRNRIMRRYPVVLAAGLWNRFLPPRNPRLLTRTGLLEKFYRRELFGETCLHELPPSPELHILSTNVSEGSLSSFTREGLLIQHRSENGGYEMVAHRAGLTKLATAVAASSAFPAFFPPLELKARDIGASEGEFPTQYFTDGGVFDNLGVRMFHYLNSQMENGAKTGPSPTAPQSGKNGVCDVILVSDVGKVFAVYGAERTPGFFSTALRSSDILMNRVWQLEREQMPNAPHCIVTAATDMVDQSADPTAMHPEVQLQVSRIRTDMDRFRGIEISGLVRHGYCVARQSCGELTGKTGAAAPTGPPWDPLADDQKTTEDVSSAARVLQRSSQRKVWRSLVDPRDWITWIYLPVIVLLLVVLPLSAYRTYRHARLNASLTRAVVEMREDFRQMLELLEFGPPEEFTGLPAQDVGKLSPRLADEGLDIISDTRITDLRKWDKNDGDDPRRVYVYRHVLVRRTTESSSKPGLRLQSLFDSADLSVQCENTKLNPVVQRSNQSSTGDPSGPFAWEIALDFSSLSVGETVEIVVGIMQSEPSENSRFEKKEWWRFEVDAQPEVATSWIILPDGHSHTEFRVVRSRNETPDVLELVEPTHETRMQGGTVESWSVVHPEPGYTYSSRWK